MHLVWTGSLHTAFKVRKCVPISEPQGLRCMWKQRQHGGQTRKRIQERLTRPQVQVGKREEGGHIKQLSRIASILPTQHLHCRTGPEVNVHKQPQDRCAH